MNFKKIILFVFIYLQFCCNAVFSADSMQITPLGSAILVNGEIIQNINVSFNADTAWKLAVTPLDANLTNIISSENQIPITDLAIVENFSNILYRFEPNKSLIITEGSETGTVNKRYILKLKNSEAYYPGTYMGIIKFSTESATNIYTATFNQPKIQKINIVPKNLSLKVTPANAMKVGYTVESSSPVRILVQSNTNWKLFLNNRSKSNLLNAKFKILSTSKNVKPLVGNDYIELKNGTTAIAEGNAPTSSNFLENEVIEIKYKFKSTENEIPSADTYFFDIEYNITE